MPKKALILTPCTGIHQDITHLMWNNKTTLASDRLQTLPLMRCLKNNNYQVQVLSFNTIYTFKEINKIEQPDICFIGKMRHNSKVEDGDKFCQFHLATVLNIKRKGAKIACIYSDNVCEYNDQDAEMYKNFLYLSDIVITPSKKLEAYASKRVGPKTLLTTIPDPLIHDQKPFKRLSPRSTCRLIWFGHNKNMSYLQDILPSLINNANKNKNYVLTILASDSALNQFKERTLKCLPKLNNWTLRLVPWDIHDQPSQFIRELGESHISLIPSDPYDTLKNGVSHNRLTDSIQLGCIALASPMDSYIELSKVCLIGKDFSKLLNKAILENGRLCSKYEALRPEILERFSPKKNLLFWEETIKALDKNLEIVK